MKNKMGAMFLITILALAGIGISYAGWTDSITVTGTVETGDVDINLVGWYSGTWVWKLIAEHGLVYHHGFSTSPNYDVDPQGFPDSDNHMLVSHAWAQPVAGADDAVDCTFDNLFPCQDFVVDFILHYDGSIPAQVNGPILIDTNDGNDGELPDNFKNSGMDWLEYLWYVEMEDNDITDGGILVEAYRCEPEHENPDNAEEITGWDITDEVVDVGYQLHWCNYVYVKITIHIPQDNDYQNLSGGFSTALEVIQWDEGPSFTQ